MIHPPSGGNAATCVISNPEIAAAGWIVIIPVILWSSMCVFVAILIINLDKNAIYPRFWIKKFEP